jgi:DNA replication protein DnaC
MNIPPVITPETVKQLRSTWNAPKRQILFTPQRGVESDAPDWWIKFESAKAQIQPGYGVTLAFVGGRGNGKTQMAVELMKLLTEHGQSALYTTSVQFFMELKATYKSENQTTEAEVLEIYRKPRLLVIDEFGKSSDAPWLNMLMFDLFNSRYQDMKDVILIDNSTPAAFEETVGPSMASRINEGGGIIEFTWPSFRR